MAYFQNEAEKAFHSEVRDKKRTAASIHKKKGKNGYVGTMRFPSDILSRKEKMEYRRSSKVTISNMYEQIMPIKDFEELETYEQKNRLQYWRNTYSNKEIFEGMGISPKRFYEFVEKLDLPKAKRVSKPRKAAAKKAKTEKESETIEPAEIIEAMTPSKQSVTTERYIPEEDGLHLKFIGTYKADTIQKRLSQFIALLNVENENDEIFVEVRITHKAAQK